MNIYLHVEISVRELDSKLLIATLAAAKGHEVLVSDIEVIEKGLIRGWLPPGIFHTKSVSHGLDKRKFHKSLFEKKFILTCIDEEHGVINEGSYEDIFIKPRIDQEDLKFFKAFFCCGNYDHRKLTSFFKKKKYFLFNWISKG